jgi:acyl-CoA reductase-like NAD-dependent aldehyde dehydrogenase
VYLDGAVQPGADELAITDRWTGAELGRVSRDAPAAVTAAVSAVASARRVPPVDQRVAILIEAARRLEERASEFAELITGESGVCIRETTREVTRAATNLKVAAAEAERLRGESIPIPGTPRLAVTLAEPVGLVAGITPFNRPLNQVVVKAAPAVAAGCALVVKPSDRTPLTALAFADLLVQSGYPKQMLAVLTGDPATVGGALAAHPDVDMVTFTGSIATGRSVAAAAAGKRVLLELGGNDPLIVLPDADLSLAARLAVDGAYGTAGQSCRGVKRVIVWEQVADRFVDLLIEAAAGKRYGDPRQPDTDLGPLIDVAAARRVETRIHQAVALGARLCFGGSRDGALMQPAVLDRVPVDSALVREETFGPVAPVLRVGDLDQAVAIANGTRYGLQAGVVTNDSAAFWELARRLRVGAVNLLEGPQFDSPHIPFGGVKASGVGREGMRYSIREMSITKTVTLPFG